MRWPSTAVEHVRASRFLPPFCPWPRCPAHRGGGSRFHRHGFYIRPSDRRRIPRYRCLTCRRTCSRQTFSFTYYLKRRQFPVPVFAGLMAGSAHRQIARSLACAKTSVSRLADRLARHALLLQARSLDELDEIREPIAHDHFETFVARQDRALAIGTPVGTRSWFTFDADPVVHAKAGRRPDRKEMPKISSGGRNGYAASIGRSLDLLLPKLPERQSLVVSCDGRKDYAAAVRAHPHRGRIVLRVWPNPIRGPKGSPRSAEARARDRAMFPVDQLHQLVRHTCKDQARETIAFGRRTETIVGREMLLIVWRNLVKGRSERKPDRRTPAMMLGLTDRPWRWAEVLHQRLFPTRDHVPQPWLALYRGLWRPPVRHRGPYHAF